MSDERVLTPAEGSTHDRKRRGRGNASGLGRQAGRGHKGWHSRSGSKRVPWFEGGQMPLIRRVPKRGFSNHPFKEEMAVVNLSSLANLDMDKIDPQVLKNKRLVKGHDVKVKILGQGDIDKAVEVIAHAFSATAKAKIEKAGGKAIVLGEEAAG